MRFQPVFLPDDRRLNGRVSQTFLRHANACPRSGFLYQLTRDQAKTMEMIRGSAGHAILERSTRATVEQGELSIPPEIVKVIADEVLADPAFPVPVEEHDYLREACFRWASETAVDPSAVIACETLFVFEVGGYQVRCKVDFAETIEGGAAAAVADWKFGRGAPAFEEVARKLPDGRLMARSFQLVLYALALAFGVPVRVDDCARCHGTGREVFSPIDGSGWEICRDCDGSGRWETPEPFPVAARAQRFDLEFVFPGIEDREGKMVRRPVTLTRAELEQYRMSLEGLLARVSHSEETGDWPAVVSDMACSECPASALCPIPAELRDHRGTVNTPDEAAEAFEVRHREKAVQRAKASELRKFVQANGPVRFGGDMVAEVVYSEHEEVHDKEGLLEAVDRAVRYGEVFERWRYVRTKGSNRLVERALSAEELAFETEGSDGRESDGEGEGASGGGAGPGGREDAERDRGAEGGAEAARDVERERDDRYGSDAPW